MIYLHCCIKTSGSELQPRKVELASTHKKHDDYHEYFTHIQRSLSKPLQNNLTALLYSLVNGLFKISTESIKLVLDAEQSGVSSNLIIPTHNVQKVSFFFLLLHILIKTLHGFHRNSIEYFSACISRKV